MSASHEVRAIASGPSREGAPRRSERHAFNRRTALGLGLGLALWVAGPSAWAAGKVVWRRTTLQELDGGWKVSVEIHLDRAPDVAHLPVRFSFKPTVHYERALVDGRDEPITRKIPLEHQTPIIESVDVGFMDPGTGKTERRTRFSFEVTRERGFEAGEYEVEISDARSSTQIGTTTTLTLQGDNPVVDRRAMVFSDKKEEPKSGASSESEQKPLKRELSPDDPEFWAGGPTAPDEEDKPLPPPASMQEKPGGCGCRIGEAPSAPVGGVLLVSLALGFFARRSSS